MKFAIKLSGRKVWEGEASSAGILASSAAVRAIAKRATGLRGRAFQSAWLRSLEIANLESGASWGYAFDRTGEPILVCVPGR